MESFQIITSDFVKVNVTNSKNDSVAFEKKFPKKLTILELKVSLVADVGEYSRNFLLGKTGNYNWRVGWNYASRALQWR